MSTQPPIFPANIDYITGPQRLELLSGVEINQNTPPTASGNFIATSGAYYYQQFTLPDTYPRGGSAWPDITGVQLCVNVPTTILSNSLTAVLLASGINTVVTSGNLIVTSGSLTPSWQFLASGVAGGVHAIGPQVWADVYFDNSIPITPQLQNATFSVGLQTNNILGWYYSSPNPYPQGAAYMSDNKTPLSPSSSFMFRLLSYSADSGIDWLGDGYRNVVFDQAASNISTFGSPDLDSYWLSKPNPSKFAVESIYFDITDGFGNPQTIDTILLDPVTQGPLFHVYYSSDGAPVVDASDWDNKLWTPVAQSYRLTKKDTFALPFPITALYIKIEFTRLQAQYYSPGTFSQPVIYNKYPMWLYNYFVGAQANTSDSFIADAVNVVYNKLQLAFDYYLGDLQSQPLAPDQYLSSTTQALPSTTTAGQVSPLTLSQINTSLAPYTLPIGATITGTSVLSNFMRSSVNIYNYPVESLAAPVAANTTTVSVPNRDAIVQQENLPDLYFFLTCRHAYQATQADFEYNRGYFVGLRQAVLMRQDYNVPNDQPFYIDTAGDGQNSYRNDFAIVANTWQVLDTDQF